MSEIVVSEVQIIPVRPKDGLLAFSSFVINNAFYVGDVAIYGRLDGSGYRLVYPDKVLRSGVKISCFYPINREAGEAIETQVFKEYQELLEKVTKINEKTQFVV